ncbi:MAG: tRNA (N6-isopentenyl adenosine(37)-C2)-methylthiotransferase MiaB [Desulfobacterales bacterium]|nr:tRNA (N6-isopentenyl adenosine(37)-C2)-methylthiotransferase MiaB [Desulfobacterales bacterium]
MKDKFFFINTIGCQMNVYDSENMASCLISLGYKKIDSVDSADIVIVNTCSIREKAEQKAFSFLGRLAKLKQNKKNLIIGVGGCVAQQEGEKIIERMPFVDFVLGTQAIGHLEDIIIKLESDKKIIVDIEKCEEIEMHQGSFEGSKNNISSFVTIMRGCENFCAYCVVPYVRGKEISRKPENILNEIKEKVKIGVREITLLGQNVNSYGKKESLCSFSELLYRINEIEGLFRIRFTTSHPKDLSMELIESFKKLDKLCGHIHLPVQSGSDNILKRMNRKYTKAAYLDKINMLRKIRPNIAITSDFIVGFPGETKKDFEETIDLIKTVEFDGIFAFVYSDRPNTPSSSFSDKVPIEEQKNRLSELLETQEFFTKKKNQSILEHTELVLVEGFSKKTIAEASQNNDKQWTGRTSSNKIVHFIEDEKFKDKISIGNLIEVKIEKAFSHSLWGKACILYK